MTASPIASMATGAYLDALHPDGISWVLAATEPLIDSLEMATIAKLRAIAAPRVATVGELLATAPHGFVIEFIDSLSGAPFQIDLRDEAIGHRMYCDWWDQEWCTDEIAARWLKLPARLVPIADIDAAPSTRGPIGEG